jgi:hypothetical protein
LQVLDAAKELKRATQELENLKNKFQNELENESGSAAAASTTASNAQIRTLDPTAASKLINATRALGNNNKRHVYVCLLLYPLPSVFVPFSMPFFFF